MKKIIGLLLAAVTMMLSLTSCSFVEKLFGGEGNSENNENNSENAVRTTITKEEWDAMLGMKNYTQKATQTSTGVIGDETHTHVVEGTIKKTEAAEYNKRISTDEGRIEYYLVNKNSKDYNVAVNDDGTVDVSESSSTISSFGTGLDVKYEDLKYDEEKKIYTCEFITDEMSVNYEFYFENGKVVKILVHGSGEMSNGSTNVTITSEGAIIITDIGTTVVEVPKFTIEE